MTTTITYLVMFTDNHSSKRNDRISPSLAGQDTLPGELVHWQSHHVCDTSVLYVVQTITAQGHVGLYHKKIPWAQYWQYMLTRTVRYCHCKVSQTGGSSAESGGSAVVCADGAKRPVAPCASCAAVEDTLSAPHLRQQEPLVGARIRASVRPSQFYAQCCRVSLPRAEHRLWHRDP